MNKSIVLGIDIGGSHITSALVDLSDRTVIEGTCKRARINSGGTVEEIIVSWTEVIRRSFSCYGIDKKIGIAMPGPFDYDKGISFIKDTAKYQSLYGLNVKKLLAENLEIPVSDIRMMNDAACFLQGEVFGGAAQGYQHAIGVTLGTGVGTAKYHGGQAEDADLWHTAFLDNIVEEYFSTRWFVNRYNSLSANVLLDVKELSLLYPADVYSNSVFKEFSENLSIFLKNFIETEKADVVVLGGNITMASEIFLPAIRMSLKAQGVHTPVLKAVLGEEAALIGAASCW